MDNDNDLKGINMECLNEHDYDYAPPKEMIKNGKPLYAYVTLIMLGDRYIPGAIAVAYHLKKIETKADLVVMVTPDVTTEGRKVLSQFYNKMVDIPLIHIPNWRTKKQPHRKYLDYVFTKFHIFNLTEYKKVILIDADALVLQHPDHLFSLPAPAGCIIPYKEDMISYDDKGNYILPKNNQIEWYNKYCECCGHGRNIPKSMTDKVIKEKGNSGVGAAILLLEPKKGELESILRDIKKEPIRKFVNDIFIWPEQQYLTYRYSGQWTGINPKFYGLQGYPHWKLLYVLQFAGDKPWFMDSKADISERIKYEDFILWHKIYRNILEDHPDLKYSKILDETNEVNKFFTVKIHREQKRNANIDNKATIKRIENLYKISNVKENQINYYHLNTELGYRPIKVIKPMFPEIKEFDYKKPIELLNDYYSTSDSNYYSRILKKINTIYPITTKQMLNEINIPNTLTEYEIDDIMLQYIKCRHNIFILTLWPNAVEHKSKIIELLKNHGNVYYTKEIELTYNGLRNLMFFMYDEFSHKTRLSATSKKLGYINANKIGKNKIAILVFDNVNNEDIGEGHRSEFKKKLREYILKVVGVENKNEIWGNDYLHINDFYYQTVEYSQVLFNKNTYRLLDNQNLDNLNSYNLTSSFLEFNTLRKWVYINMSQLEIMRFCLIGGSVLYSYGIRKSGDIDAIMLNTKSTSSTEFELQSLVNVNFHQNDTKFSFADIGIEDSEYWRSSWSDKNNKLLSFFGIKNFSEVILNPEYHYYYNGIKLYIIDIEIVRKIMRYGEPDIADICVMTNNYKSLISDYVQVKDGKLVYSESTSKIERKNNKVNYYKIIEYLKRKYNSHISNQFNINKLKELIS